MIFYFDGKLINIINEIWGIMIAILGLILLSMQSTKIQRIKLLFQDLKRLFFFVMLVTFCDMLTLIFDGATTPLTSAIVHAADFLVFFINCVLLIGIMLYSLDSVEGDFSERKGWLTIFGVIMAIDVGILLLNLRTGWIYYFDSANIYHRGTYFWVNHAIAIVYEIILLVFVMIYKKKIRRIFRLNIYAFVIIPTLSLLLQLVVNGVAFLYISETLTLLVILISLFQYNIERVLEQQQELSDTYLSSMISQIQPHFLYNVLMSIIGVEGNPPETKNALANFGKYLRGNMDVIQSKEPISFMKELQHVDAYVNLEKLRFQESLNVEYDLQVKDFEIAALSVQMMVENAIKHGIRPKAGGGTVRIETRELPKYFQVRIIDDGVGFDLEKMNDTSRNHVGITSTRERLRIMVDGEFEMESTPGKGTIVTIKIPKMEYDDEYFSS